MAWTIESFEKQIMNLRKGKMAISCTRSELLRTYVNGLAKKDPNKLVHNACSMFECNISKAM